LLRGRLRHTGVRLVRARDPPLTDPGALADPLVRGVELARELVVRHHAFGRVPTRGHELRDGALHRGAPPSASSATMSRSRWLVTIWVATRTAFLIARAGEAP